MNKPTKYYSTAQENMIADFLGWRVVAGSGARDLSPGDIISPTFLGECKTHTKKLEKIFFYSDFWCKICEEASARFKYPVMFVDNGTQKIENTWVITFAHSVNESKCSKYKLPVKVDVNIIFDPEYLSNVISYLQQNTDKHISFYTQFENADVVIMKLEDFSEVIK